MHPDFQKISAGYTPGPPIGVEREGNRRDSHLCKERARSASWLLGGMDAPACGDKCDTQTRSRAHTEARGNAAA